MIANFRRLFLAALAAGLAAGILTSAIQAVTTTPLILAAEVYETGDATAPLTAHHRDYSKRDEKAAPEDSDPDEWEPAEGFERFFFTAVANILTGIGFALVLVAGYSMSGDPVNGRRGVVWGLAGYAVFSLAPGLGLPPEIPGSIAAELVSRQGWWLFAAGSTALGLWLMVFGDGRIRRVLGILAMIVPHAVGAPHPDAIGGAGPPELAAQFAATSLVVNAIFWACLGWVSGTVYARSDT